MSLLRLRLLRVFMYLLSFPPVTHILTFLLIDILSLNELSFSVYDLPYHPSVRTVISRYPLMCASDLEARFGIRDLYWVKG